MTLHRTWTGTVALAAVALLPAGARSAAAAPAPASAPRMEVVFVLDTTASMGGLLEAAKQQIWAIVSDLACAQPTPELRLGLVAFRDRGDDYVTRRLDLTPDVDAFYAELIGLQAGGGGDGPESVNQALHEAVTTIGWSSGPRIYRTVFLVGDAPPHMDYDRDVLYAVSCQLAGTRGIAINAIQCGDVPGTLPIWTDIARRGGGTVGKLKGDGAAEVVVTPWDKGMAAMARQLDGTRLAYGTDAERAEFEQRRARAERIAAASPDDVLASRGEFNASEAGRKHVYGSNDLVADWQSGRVRLEDLDEARLPDVLRAMAPAERRTYLENLAKVRGDLEWTLRSFAEKRRDRIAKELGARGGGTDSLTAQMFTAMQPQAARHGFDLAACAKRDGR